jgi:hypothetical protein
MTVGARVDVLAGALEDLLDRLVQLGAVGDDQHPRVRRVLAGPLREPHHDQALAAALGVPEDAALATAHGLLRGADAEVLIVAAGLLQPCVKDHAVVDGLKQPLLSAERAQLSPQRVVTGRRQNLGRRLGLLPAQPVLL